MQRVRSVSQNGRDDDFHAHLDSGAAEGRAVGGGMHWIERTAFDYSPPLSFLSTATGSEA